MEQSRISWSEYFLDMAEVVSKRSTCTRLKVGSVIISGTKNVMSTGYNGACAGEKHCDQRVDSHECGEGVAHCNIAIHSELNAILSAAKNGVRVDGCTIYCTHRPCINCYRYLTNAGIAKIVYRDSYGDMLDSDYYKITEEGPRLVKHWTEEVVGS